MSANLRICESVNLRILDSGKFCMNLEKVPEPFLFFVWGEEKGGAGERGEGQTVNI